MDGAWTIIGMALCFKPNLQPSLRPPSSRIQNIHESWEYEHPETCPRQFRTSALLGIRFLTARGSPGPWVIDKVEGDTNQRAQRVSYPLP